MKRQSIGDFQGSENILYELEWWILNIMHLLKLKELFNPNSEPKFFQWMLVSNYASILGISILTNSPHHCKILITEETVWRCCGEEQEVYGNSLFYVLSTVAQSYLTLCDPMDYSTPGFPVCHQLPEPTQTHAHHISNAIQPSHPRSSPSPPTCNLSQHHFMFYFSIKLKIL